MSKTWEIIYASTIPIGIGFSEKVQGGVFSEVFLNTILPDTDEEWAKEKADTMARLNGVVDKLNAPQVPAGSLIISPDKVEALKELIGFAKELVNEPSVHMKERVMYSIDNLEELLQR